MIKEETLYFALSMFLILINGCEHQDIGAGNTITCGEYTEMYINNYDTLFHGEYHDKRNFDLDVNDDNNPDIRLISEIWGSPGIGQHPLSEIHCLHENIGLRGIITSDTLFYHESTYSELNGNNVILFYLYKYFGYTRVEQGDSVVSINENVFEISPLRKGERLSTADCYITDSLTVSSNNIYVYRDDPQMINEDTIRIITETQNYNRYNFPQEEIRYIGFKCEEKGNQYLGWIKLSIIDNYKFSLIETAIQKR